MSGNLPPLLTDLIVFLSTYLLHSSLLLIAAWLLFRRWRTTSPCLCERVWKIAAVGALLTTPVQLFWGISEPTVSLSIQQLMSTDTAESIVSGVDNRSADVKSELVSVPVEEPSTSVSHDPRFAKDTPVFDWPDASVIASGHENSDHPRDERKEHRRPSNDTERAAHLSNQPVGRSSSNFNSRLQTAIAAKQSQDLEPPAPGHGTAFAPATPRSRFAGFATLAALLLATLVTAGLFRWAAEMAWFHRRIRCWEPIDSGPLRSILDALLVHAKVRRRVTLLSSRKDPEPAAFGLFRWQIVVPAGIEHKHSHDELKALMAHELAHLVRGDTYWLWLGRLLCSLFAFQPLNFLARREWQRAAEFGCDDWAIRHQVSPITLARCLTQVAEWRLDHPRVMMTLAAGGTQSSLSERVERLVEETPPHDPWTTRSRICWIGLCGIAVVTLLALWGPRTVLHADSPPEETMLHDHETANASTESPERHHDTEHAASAETIEPRNRHVHTDLIDPAGPISEELASLEQELQQLREEIDALNHTLNGLKNHPRFNNTLEKLRNRLDAMTRLQEQLTNSVDRLNNQSVEPE